MKNYPYEVTEIAEGIYLINEKLSTMYIIKGTERALVIDCGTGVGDFRELVDNITDMPYDLVATHSHVDHIGGRGQFPHMYISPEDAPWVSGASLAVRKGYAGINTLMGNKINRAKATFEKTVKEPELHYIFEGDEFDLGGGRVAEIIEAPGHTKGSVCVLLRSERMLFTGDVINPTTLMCMPNAATITQLVKTVDKLYGMEGYDIFWPSHSTEYLTKESIPVFRQLAVEIKELGSGLPGVAKKSRGQFSIYYNTANIRSSADILRD